MVTQAELDRECLGDGACEMIAHMVAAGKPESFVAHHYQVSIQTVRDVCAEQSKHAELLKKFKVNK